MCAKLFWSFKTNYVSGVFSLHEIHGCFRYRCYTQVWTEPTEVFILFFPLIGLTSSIINLENLEAVGFIKQILDMESISWTREFIVTFFCFMLTLFSLYINVSVCSAG